jgi:hypothetical protein
MSATTVLPFAGGELSSFDPLDNGTLEESSDNSRFDATVSRCGIQVGAASAGMRSPIWAAASDFWFHAFLWIGSGSAGYSGPLLNLYDGATIVAQLSVSGLTVTVKTLQSGVLTSVGSFALLSGPTGACNALDLRVMSGANATVSAFLAGTEILTATGLDHTGFAGVTQCLMPGVPNGAVSPVVWSQVICDGVAHVGDKLVTLAEDTASGINTGWTGAVTAINEAVLDDSHSVTSDTAGQVSTYYKNGASLGTWNVVAVCVGARAQLTAGSPTNLQICLRTNGSNYFGPTTALDFGFQAVCASWTTNPFTAAPWDTVTAAAVEVGMKSIA